MILAGLSPVCDQAGAQTPPPHTLPGARRPLPPAPAARQCRGADGSDCRGLRARAGPRHPSGGGVPGVAAPALLQPLAGERGRCGLRVNEDGRGPAQTARPSGPACAAANRLPAARPEKSSVIRHPSPGRRGARGSGSLAADRAAGFRRAHLWPGRARPAGLLKQSPAPAHPQQIRRARPTERRVAMPIGQRTAVGAPPCPDRAPRARLAQRRRARRSGRCAPSAQVRQCPGSGPFGSGRTVMPTIGRDRMAGARRGSP